MCSPVGHTNMHKYTLEPQKNGLCKIRYSAVTGVRHGIRRLFTESLQLFFFSHILCHIPGCAQFRVCMAFYCKLGDSFVMRFAGNFIRLEWSVGMLVEAGRSMCLLPSFHKPDIFKQEL